jgi:NADPH:quinone reductase-like Zn-dependent oxidoreductase
VVRRGCDEEEGAAVIPLTLLMVFLPKLIRDGKQVPLFPDLVEDNAWYRETLTELLDLLAEGRIKPVVAERIPLAEAVRAHELLEGGGYAGKVVLIVGA